MGSQPSVRDVGVQVGAQIQKLLRIARNDVVNGMPRDQSTRFVDPESRSLGDILAEDLRSQEVGKRRRLVKCIPRLSFDACPGQEFFASSRSKQITSQRTEFALFH